MSLARLELILLQEFCNHSKRTCYWKIVVIDRITDKKVKNRNRNAQRRPKC